MELAEIKKIYVRETSLKTRSKATKDQYWSCVSKFYKSNSRIYRMSKNDLKNYMAEFRNEYSDSYYNVMGSSLKVLFEKVLNQPEKMNWFFTVKTDRQYHDIITNDDFVSMMKSAKNIKHKFIIILLFSTDIRETEFINIKLSDINYEDDSVFIRSLKNGKNRHVSLRPLCRKYLLAYLKQYVTVEYLLNGQSKAQYTASSMLKIIKKVSNNKYTVHDFRHTFSTLTIENENVFRTKEILGHKSLESTLHYYHIPKNKLNSMYNPLDDIAC